MVFVFGNFVGQRYFDPVWVWQIWQQAGGRASVSSCEGLLINGWTGPGHEECLGCEMDCGVGTHGVSRGAGPGPTTHGPSVAPQLANSEHLPARTLWLWRHDDIVSDTDNCGLWYGRGMSGTFLWMTKFERIKDRRKSRYLINIQIQDVIEIQDKSLFKVQKASQVEKFTIVVGWRSISLEGRRRLRSTRSWFIPGNFSQASKPCVASILVQPLTKSHSNEECMNDVPKFIIDSAEWWSETFEINQVESPGLGVKPFSIAK